MDSKEQEIYEELMARLSKTGRGGKSFGDAIVELTKEINQYREKIGRLEKENLELVKRLDEHATLIDNLTTIFTPEELKVILKTTLGKISSITVDFYDE